jgi:uncharacterized protein (DUF1499 family)
MYAPVINDISTDLANPPAFVKGNIGPLPESFKPKIANYYTSLGPLKTDKPTDAVYATALEIARSTSRWEVTYTDEASGVIQGVATTFLMRFKDDFVIRVGKDGATGSIVDMRSKSRLGKGDMGANAARIQSFLQELSTKLTADAGSTS